MDGEHCSVAPATCCVQSPFGPFGPRNATTGTLRESETPRFSPCNATATANCSAAFPVQPACCTHNTQRCKLNCKQAPPLLTYTRTTDAPASLSAPFSSPVCPRHGALTRSCSSRPRSRRCRPVAAPFVTAATWLQERDDHRAAGTTSRSHIQVGHPPHVGRNKDAPCASHCLRLAGHAVQGRAKCAEFRRAACDRTTQ